MTETVTFLSLPVMVSPVAAVTGSAPPGSSALLAPYGALFCADPLDVPGAAHGLPGALQALLRAHWGARLGMRSRPEYPGRNLVFIWHGPTVAGRGPASSSVTFKLRQHRLSPLLPSAPDPERSRHAYRRHRHRLAAWPRTQGQPALSILPLAGRSGSPVPFQFYPRNGRRQFIGFGCHGLDSGEGGRGIQWVG
jgi:hypothetical protein